MPRPSFAYLEPSEWEIKISAADALASACRLCPRACGVNRHSGQTGFCGATNAMKISSIFPHFGEEPPLCGTGGSGTIFFSHCTLGCCFCQNYQLSDNGIGDTYTVSDLALKMLDVMARGCHNINLVTATHYLPWMLRALQSAAEQGLEIPLVYNCGGYESLETIDILKGIVDIWLPDMKYGSNKKADLYSGASNYVEVNRAAIAAMMKQCGPLKVDKNGIGYRGVIIRHLVLPNQVEESLSLVEYLTNHFDPDDCILSLMAQYTPLHRALDFPELSRKLTQEEYRVVYERCLKIGFDGFYQNLESMDDGFVIDFTKRKAEELR